jgi:glycosyltransferase involved in cell wall biosynthesis
MKILLIAAFDAPFIQDDLALLRKHYKVCKQVGHGFRAAVKIVFRVVTADVVYCWFASTYAFIGVLMAHLLGKKTIVIVGGVDAAKDQELGYGIWLNPWKAKLVRWVYRHATHVLVVDQSLKEKIIELAQYPGSNISCVPTGYDSSFWKPLGVKEPVVLTVAMARDRVTFNRKGIDLLIEAANALPAVQFVVIGTDPTLALESRPSLNIKFYTAMARNDLLPFYQTAKVYCQPSRWEGLPNALCEAMSCECTPVATEVGGSPTAVGHTGFLVPVNNVEALTIAIQKALAADQAYGMEARARIVALFPKEKRETELLHRIGGSRR